MENRDFSSISVLIITYNQQNVIGRAIESVLCQKNYGLKEIVVCDDCSKDNNWEIVNKYASQYPDIIRAYQNNPNLGIYGNLEKLVSLRGNSDLYYILSADDAMCDGYFKKVQSFIFKHKIDLNNNFVIYSDWKAVNPKGREVFFKNDKVRKHVPIFRLLLRMYIYNRSTLLSKGVIDQFKHVTLEHGVSLSEMLFELQYTLYSDYSYYCPFVGSVYFSQTGVSTKMKTKKNAEENIYMWKYILEHFDLCKKDRTFVMQKIQMPENKLNFSSRSNWLVIKYHIYSFDPQLGLDLKQEYFFWRSFVKGIIK
jgi:glycosyltransferase involved in cell wall biosynthesis